MIITRFNDYAPFVFVLNVFPDIEFHERNRDYPVVHTHDFYEFVFCKKGMFEHLVDDKRVDFSEGQFFLIPPGHSHCLWKKTPEVMECTISLTPKIMEEKAAFFGEDFASTYLKDVQSGVFSASSQHYIESLLSSLRMSKKKDYPLITNLIVLEILKLISLGRVLKKPYDDALEDLVRQIQDPKNVQWKVRDVVAVSNFSQTHLNRLFQKAFHVSIIEYLMRVKMENARNLLICTNKTTKEISLELGYRSVSYFSHAFEEYFHISPIGFRKQIRSQEELDPAGKAES